jgi:glycosyltransferase involved in cell wall biosynthesis
MAVGCTIVGSDTPPVREAIEHGQNGLLTPFHDPSALAEKVVGVLADPASYALLGKTARATALARYDKDDCLARALELLGVEPQPTVRARVGDEGFDMIELSKAP